MPPRNRKPTSVTVPAFQLPRADSQLWTMGHSALRTAVAISDAFMSLHGTLIVEIKR